MHSETAWEQSEPPKHAWHLHAALADLLASAGCWLVIKCPWPEHGRDFGNTSRPCLPTAYSCSGLEEISICTKFCSLGCFLWKSKTEKRRMFKAIVQVNKRFWDCSDFWHPLPPAWATWAADWQLLDSWELGKEAATRCFRFSRSGFKISSDAISCCCCPFRLTTLLHSCIFSAFTAIFLLGEEAAAGSGTVDQKNNQISLKELPTQAPFLSFSRAYRGW